MVLDSVTTSLMPPILITVNVWKENAPPKRMTLLEGMSFLKKVWPCLRKCVTLEVGFEVSFAQVMSRISVYFFLPVSKDVGSSAPFPAPYLPECHHVAP